MPDGEHTATHNTFSPWYDMMTSERPNSDGGGVKEREVTDPATITNDEHVFHTLQYLRDILYKYLLGTETEV